MKICVIGTGYVGLVTGACLANLGNDVICVDKDKARIASLKKNVVPFYEPGLEELVKKNSEAGRLSYTTELKQTVKSSEIVFIAVGTPSRSNGEADVSAIIDVAGKIAKALKGARKRDKYTVIVNKSTVPVGMGDIVTDILVKNGLQKKTFAVVSNPEFLREGSAISDFMSPDRIVIGASDNRAFNLITELYRSLNAHIVFTSIKSAELIKYASNAFLATRISFINEISNICERVGSDVTEVAHGMGLDKRIGSSFLSAGLGFGGSCLPKDVSALIHLAQSNGYEPSVLTSVKEINHFQREFFMGKIVKALGKTDGKKIAVLGLSFKPETDDLREAPSIDVIRELKRRKAKVQAYDPAAKPKKIRELFGSIKLCKSSYEAIKGCDALVVLTEWNEFKELDLEKVKSLMKKPLIFDGRNIYDPKKMKDIGFKYIGIGRK